MAVFKRMGGVEEDLSVPIFVLPGQVVFPHERVTLDARTGANIALFAALLSPVSSVLGENVREPTLFAIAPFLHSRIGTVAAVDNDAPKPNWVGGALRLHAVSLFPYELLHVFDPEENKSSQLGSWGLHRGFQLCRARRRYDFCSPRVPLDCFPSLSWGNFCRTRFSAFSKGSRTRTRSVSRIITKRFGPVVRSSLVDVSARAWAAFDERALLKQMRTVAKPHERFMQLDEHLIRAIPKDEDTPAKWSYWFAAAMSGHMSEAQQIELLEERVPALRLRHLLRICNSLNPGLSISKHSKLIGRRGRREDGKLSTRPENQISPTVKAGSSHALPGKLSCAATRAVLRNPLPIFDKASFSEIHCERATKAVFASMTPSTQALAHSQHRGAKNISQQRV